MGLLDLFQKGKQVVTDVQDEIENWRSLDPDVLRAITDGDLILAKNLYMQKMEASRVRAALVVEKIAGTVQEDYPSDPAYWTTVDPEVLTAIHKNKAGTAIAIYMKKTGASYMKASRVINSIGPSVFKNYYSFLVNEALEAISDVWPYKESVLIGFKPAPHDKNRIRVASIKLTAWIGDDPSETKLVLEKYSLGTDCTDYCDEPFSYFKCIGKYYTAIFKDGVFYLRNEDGDVMELEDYKIGELNFNVKDSEYKRYKKFYDLLTSENAFEAFDKEDLRKVKEGKMSEKALLSAATRYKFFFKQRECQTLSNLQLQKEYKPYYLYYFICDLETENIDLKNLLKKHYLDFYKEIGDVEQVVPWQDSILKELSHYNKESCDKLDSVICEYIRTNFPECETLAKECARKAKSLIHTLNNKRSFSFNCAEMRLNTQDTGEDKPIAVLALPLFDDIFYPTDDGIAALHRFPIHKPFENLELSIQLFKDKTKKIVLSANGLYREFSVIAKKKK